MFTCSSCGYEANPDSAPACSLCGTKRPVKAGAKEEAPAPKPAAAPAASASSSSTATKSATATKSDTKKPKGAELDDLASAAQAVADSQTNEPVVTSKGARSRPAAGAAAVVTTTGILRMGAQAPPIDNAITVMGAFIGALIAYAFEWQRGGGAPSSLVAVVILAVAATVFGLLARFLIAPSLEETLGYDAKVRLHGPIAGATGGGLAIFALVAFFAASHATPVVSAEAGGPIDGAALGTRLALLTPWTITLKTDKIVVLALKGKASELRLPSGPLGAEELASIQKATGFSRADLERLVGSEPIGRTLPPEFSVDTFLDRIATVYGIRRDGPRPREQRTGTLLFRRRKNGVDELLSLPASPKTPFDLQTALSNGIPTWIGVSLGIPHDSTSDHDTETNAVYDQFRPAD